MNDPTLTPGDAGGERLNILRRNPIMTGGFVTATDIANLKLGITDSDPHLCFNGCGEPGSILSNPGELDRASRYLYGVVPLQHQGNANPFNDNNQGETQGVRERFWRIGGVLLLVLLLAVLLAARAEAEPRLRTSCTIYATNRVDPIAHAQHLHHHFGNTSTTNTSTGNILFKSKSTSCRDDWFRSAGWFPVEENEPVSRVAVYYRAPGNQTQIRAIPKGLQIVAVDQDYRCNTGPGEEPFQQTPPYGCRQEWSTRVIFPDCWNRQSLEETTMVSSNRGVCPSSHPYRIPRINYLILHKNTDGVVPNPLRVSAGVDAWEDWPAMHGDYFAANLRVLNRELLDLCLRNAPDSVTVADPRCGKEPK